MKPVRIGLGLRSLRSLRPRPMRYRHKCMAHAGQRGHFRIGEKGTFLLCVYRTTLRLDRSILGIYALIELLGGNGAMDTADIFRFTRARVDVVE